ncbi:MAG: hypothetical protein HFJ80_06495 [Clostridiales bacterium]|nr:hypothetical protein [Clostridiales bacterium]
MEIRQDIPEQRRQEVKSVTRAEQMDLRRSGRKKRQHFPAAIRQRKLASARELSLARRWTLP